MTSPKQISDMLAIAERAIEVQHAEGRRKEARQILSEAYVDWKDENGLERVEKDTLEWIQMMHSTRREYDDFLSAKRREVNARRRLANAVSRYSVGGHA